MNATDRIGLYLGLLLSAHRAAAGALWRIGAICALLPWSVKAVLDPWVVVRLKRLLIGGAQLSAGVGEIIALAVLVPLVWGLYGSLIAFYRRAGGMVPFWPLTLVLGLTGNFVWWYFKVYFEVTGTIAGLAPMLLLLVFEQWAMAQVFGPGRPNAQGARPDAMFGR